MMQPDIKTLTTDLTSAPLRSARPRRTLPSSLLRAGLAARLAIVAGIAACLWLAIVWALA